jgi:1-phosphofructokinase
MPGPELTAEAATALLEQVLEQLERLVEHAHWVVLSGSLPPGMPMDAYATMTRRAQAAGAAVLLDTSGAPLKAALATGPRLVKPNRQELAELVHRPLDTLEAVIAAGREVLNSASAGAGGGVAGRGGRVVSHRHEALLAHPLSVAVTSTVGAGDAMVAGLVAARLEGRSLTETAQLATAFAAAKLMRLGPICRPRMKSAPWPDRSRDPR